MSMTTWHYLTARPYAEGKLHEKIRCARRKGNVETVRRLEWLAETIKDIKERYKNERKKICPYYDNPKCTLVSNSMCEANPDNPQSCADYINRQQLYGVTYGFVRSATPKEH